MRKLKCKECQKRREQAEAIKRLKKREVECFKEFFERESKGMPKESSRYKKLLIWKEIICGKDVDVDKNIVE